MTESLTVFGFGSFFTGNAQPNDIDLLLLHRSADVDSCVFAINCKAQIKLAIPSADIVMLSMAENESLKFLERSSAVKLAILSSDRTDEQFLELTSRLMAFNSPGISETRERLLSGTLCAISKDVS